VLAVTAKTHLSRYAGVGNDFYERLSLVNERLLKALNPRGSKERIGLTVFTDANGQPIVTLPRQFNTILAGNFVCSTNRARSWPLPITNEFDEFQVNGPGMETGLCLDSFKPVVGRFTTFLDWTIPMLLRFKFEANEAAGKIIVRGSLNGITIYSTDGPNWIEGVAVPFVGNTTVTTTQQFDLSPYTVIKPVTVGRVSMYIVDASGNETLVAVYDPTETQPAWRRYHVPSATAAVALVPPVTPFPPLPTYTKAEIDALFGDFADITVSSTVTQFLAPQVPFFEWNQHITAQAGPGAYTAQFVLDTAFAKRGAVFRINIDLVQSGNPKIQIVDGATSTVLQEVDGDSSNPLSFFFESRWTGAKWIKSQGYFLT
jgi:hypothetical protein